MHRLFYVALMVISLSDATASAHYNMLLPSKHSVKKDEVVTYTYQWGHPFEHQLFDAPKPVALFVVDSNGDRVDLLEKLEKFSVDAGEGKKAVAYRFSFTPKERGDYSFVLKTPPIWMEEDGEYLQDTVKSVVHVQAQKGWDMFTVANEPEVRPMTRPYGLLPGTIFQGVAQRKTADFLSGARVEVERYNAVPPKDLPADEFITRTLNTDKNGTFTTTLPEPGWWCMAVLDRAATLVREGKDKPLKKRLILWVFVDEKPSR